MSINKFIKDATKTICKSSKMEAATENHFCEYAKKRGCKALKLVLLSKRGFPDRTILCPGARILFIEFKRHGAKQSQHQKTVQKYIERLGFEYHVCYEASSACKFLDDFLKKFKKV